MSKLRPDLSIIIPAYNEARRLPPSLRAVLAYCAQHPERRVEILVIDDGSTDGTAVAAQNVDPSIRVITVNHFGKGAAVRTGILASHGEWMLFTDSDLSTPIETLDRFWSLRTEHDIILGSRALPDSDIRKAQSRVKVLFGRFGNAMIRWLAVPGVRDTQCGFKLFHRRCRFLFDRQRVTGWGFDFEILFLAKKYGYRIVELPVQWTNDAASKVKSSDYVRTFLDLLAIRLNDFRGFYR